MKHPKQLQFTCSSIQSEMATVEELVQMMNTLQGQQHALDQEISRLTAGNQQFRQAVAHQGWRRPRLQLDKQFRQRFLMRTPRSSERQSLVDIKGLGKPPNVQGKICGDSPSVSGRPRGSDCCILHSFPASDRMGARSRQHYHERSTRPTVRSAWCRTS